MVRSRGVASHADGFVPMRVKWLAETFFAIYTVSSEKLIELLEGHTDTLAELFR